jgi:adenine-specific DNA-methyltransferase
VLDFFAGSGSMGQAIWEQNALDGGTRQFILVQLPEPLSEENKEDQAAIYFCDQLQKPRNIAELTKERLRRAGTKIKGEYPLFAGDLGFKVFKLDTSNIRAWEPHPEDLPGSLLSSVEHIREGRIEDDILFELLLKLGLELTVAMEQRLIQGKTVHCIGGGVLLICLDTTISATDYEALALGMAAWHKELAPAGESTFVFRDSAFADDVVKTNLTAILSQHGLDNVRSL